MPESHHIDPKTTPPQDGTYTAGGYKIQPVRYQGEIDIASMSDADKARMGMRYIARRYGAPSVQSEDAQRGYYFGYDKGWQQGYAAAMSLPWWRRLRGKR
jgi:hypothetical protein